MKIIEKYYPVFVAFLLILMLFFEVSSALKESQTIDEGVHLAAGYSYLMKRDFRMNTEHPPLAKELAALPLFIINNQLKQPFNQPSWNEYNQWEFAQDFIYENNISADKIIFLGRLPTMLLSLVLGLFIFRWSREIFGTLAGLFSLILYCFSPNIIAHSRYITTDLALSLFFFLTLYYFYKYLKSPTLKNFIKFSILFALAQVTKFSALLLIPIILILLIYFFYFDKNKLYVNAIKKNFLIKLFIVIIITSLTIFIAYGFEFKKPINDINVQQQYAKLEQTITNNEISEKGKLVQQIIKITDPETKSGQFIKNIAETVYIPAFSYLNGLVKLYFHNYHGHTAYLLNSYSDSGWWYYFPLAFLVKTPTSLQILMLMAFILAIFKYIKRPFKNIIKKIPNPAYILIIPPLIYFIFSMSGKLNIGLRHILVVYPFIYIILGWLIIIKLKKWKRLFYFFLSLLLLFFITSSLLIYPHYLAYFNVISGGPNNGHKYLVDSNIDWGQDVKKLKGYMDQNMIEYVCFSYFGQAKLDYYDIDYQYLPNNQNFKGIKELNCVVAISLTSLLSREREYDWLLDYEPDDKIGYSIYIYDFRNKSNKLEL